MPNSCAQQETIGLSKGGGGRKGVGSRVAPVEMKPTLADAGIDKKLSSRAQKEAVGLNKGGNPNLPTSTKSEGVATLKDAVTYWM